jgi:hypothetical protein
MALPAIAPALPAFGPSMAFKKENPEGRAVRAESGNAGGGKLYVVLWGLSVCDEQFAAALSDNECTCMIKLMQYFTY